VLSGINAMKGAIALYDDGDRKAAATIHYSTYRINRDRVVDRFLWMYLRHEVFQEILTRHVPAGIKTELAGAGKETMKPGLRTGDPESGSCPM
jgi:hypothetical protein